MTKAEILKEVKMIKQMLEFTPSEWAEEYSKKFNRNIERDEVYQMRTGVAVSKLDCLLEKANI